MRKGKHLKQLAHPKPVLVTIDFENKYEYVMTKRNHGWIEHHTGLHARSLKLMKKFIRKHMAGWLRSRYA